MLTHDNSGVGTIQPVASYKRLTHTVWICQVNQLVKTIIRLCAGELISMIEFDIRRLF